jgi:rod shape-determining protein MreD
LKILRYFAALVGITVATSLAHWRLPSHLLPFDLFLLATVAVALRSRQMQSQLFGLAAGLCQDAFSGGIIGINALAKTMVGYAVSGLKDVILIRGIPQRTFTFALATAADMVVVAGVRATFSLGNETSLGSLAARLAANTILGFILALFIWRREEREKTVRPDEKS